MNYKQKYLKYKTKYLYVKKQIGGFNKIYNVINYILSNTFLSFKESKPNTISLFVIDCITLTEILIEASENIEKNPEVISVPQQKAELDMIKKVLKFFIDSDFLQSLGATQEIINYLRTDPEGKIYKDTKDKTYIYNLYQVEDILEFSLLDTENPINLQIGELIWRHITFLCEKYFYLLNLYKKYKITSTILYFNDDGIFDLCSSFDNNHKCLKIENLCEWKDEKCQGKKEKDEPILFNYEDGSDYDDMSSQSSNFESESISDGLDDYSIITPKYSNVYYNTKLMNILRESFPFNLIQFFLNTNFIEFKERSNRNKKGQYELIRLLGNYSEIFLQNIINTIKNNPIILKKLSIIREKTFFIKKGVDKKDIEYYLEDPNNLIYKPPLRHEDWINGKNLRFFNTELYEILEYGLQKGEKYNPILKIYWIHMQDLCKIYYKINTIFKENKIPFTDILIDLDNVCNEIKNQSLCKKKIYCTWNERGELNKQCEIKPTRWK